ncbi:MAG: hypothetical protein R3B72_06860 [Polyangiaceae bacterium]
MTGPTQTFDNSAYSPDLTAGKTTKTLIENNPIALQDTHWGGKSESPGGIGVNGADHEYAWITTGSTNLFIEGKPAGRTQDPTKQNRGNSDGKVEPGAIAPRAESREEYAKKKCQLKKWEGTSAMGGKLGHMTLNTVGDPNYLEIYDKDVVTFSATRHDITQHPPRVNVKCDEDHTWWKARAKVFPFFQRENQLPEGDDPQKGTDTFVVPASMAMDLWSNSDTIADFAEGNFEGALGKILHKLATNDGDQPDLDYGNRDPWSPNGFDGGSAPVADLPAGQVGGFEYGTKGFTGDQSYNESPKLKTPGRGQDLTQGGKGPGYKEGDKPWEADNGMPKWFDGDIRTLMFFAYWYFKPPEISVTATSCAGSRKATLKVLPHNMVKFKIKLDGAIKAAGRGVKGLAQRNADDKDKAREDAAKENARRGIDKHHAEEAVAGLQDKLDAAIAKQSRHGKGKNGRARRQTIYQKEVAPLKRELESQLQRYEQAMAKYDKAERAFNSAYAALQTAQDALKLCEAIGDVASTPFHAKILKGFKLEVKVQYKRTENKMSAMGWREYTTATMGQKWEFTLQVQPLIEVSWTVYFSLLELAGPYMRALAQAMRRLRIFRVDIFFGINMGAVVGVGAIKDEHDVINLLGKAYVELYANPTMGAVMGGGGVDLIEFRATLPVKCKVDFIKPTERGPVLQSKFSGQITNNYRCTLFPDRFWEIEAFSGSIPGLRWYFKPAKANLGSLPA